MTRRVKETIFWDRVKELPSRLIDSPSELIDPCPREISSQSRSANSLVFLSANWYFPIVTQQCKHIHWVSAMFFFSFVEWTLGSYAVNVEYWFHYFTWFNVICFGLVCEESLLLHKKLFISVPVFKTRIISEHCTNSVVLLRNQMCVCHFIRFSFR